MARPLRIEFEGAVYHLTARGNAHAMIFLNDEDRALFMETVEKVIARFGWICHAYCLMSNHYHLLIETPSPNLSRGMQLLNGVYTQSFNRRHKRSGHVFQGRFKAILVEKESHLLELARYVALNPVRAGLARSAKDWAWSSYRATAGLGAVPGFLTTDWILSRFSEDRSLAVKRYRSFVSEGSGVDVWAGLRAGSLLGTDAFAERVRPLLQSAPVDPHILRKEATAARPALKELFADVKDKRERDHAIHRAVRAHHYTLQEVAEHLGLHYSTISVIAKRVDT
jgi:putative transposase